MRRGELPSESNGHNNSSYVVIIVPAVGGGQAEDPALRSFSTYVGLDTHTLLFGQQTTYLPGVLSRPPAAQPTYLPAYFFLFFGQATYLPTRALSVRQPTYLPGRYLSGSPAAAYAAPTYLPRFSFACAF
jgi:hypothetical protein